MLFNLEGAVQTLVIGIISFENPQNSDPNLRPHLVAVSPGKLPQALARSAVTGSTPFTQLPSAPQATQSRAAPVPEATSAPGGPAFPSLALPAPTTT